LKNKYEMCGEITKLICTHRAHGTHEVLISTSDLPRVNEFTGTWFLMKFKKSENLYVYGTIQTGGKPTTYALHRWIKEVPQGLVIDHINHNTLDNRNENLRVVTHSQNHQNRKGASKHSKSGYRNVTWLKRNKKWRVSIKTIDQERPIYLGEFDDVEEANQAAIEARKKYMPYSTA
jgi:hypothetical protein